MSNRLPQHPSYGEIADLFDKSEGLATKKLIHEVMDARDRVSDTQTDLSVMFTQLLGYTRDIALHATAAIAELESRIAVLERTAND